MADFPTVRVLDAATFNEEDENVSIEPGKMEGGYVISRPRFTRAPRITWSFKFRDMNDTDKETLRAFWRNVAKGCSNAFNWTHPQTGVVYNVRFHEMNGLKFNREGYGDNNRWATETITLRQV